MSESITKELRSVNAVTLTEMLASGKWDGYRAIFMSTTLRDSMADLIDARFTRKLEDKQAEIDALKSDNADLQARLDASIQPPVDADGVPNKQTDDPVDHPSHYCAGDIECIDAIASALGHDGLIAFCRGSAIKYLWRAGRKGDIEEDLRKAAWYCERAAKEASR